jgi:hypothetical protein
MRKETRQHLVVDIIICQREGIGGTQQYLFHTTTTGCFMLSRASLSFHNLPLHIQRFKQAPLSHSSPAGTSLDKTSYTVPRAWATMALRIPNPGCIRLCKYMPQNMLGAM